MITMNELVDLRMQQHIAHEFYRQQIMQRIPDPFPHMLQMPMPRHVIMPPRVTLPGVEATLQNDDLWKQFHQIGTEMIITKSGRRMFPSMRLSLAGLEEESNYCVLLEMVPIGDCRYKFSGSQWVPAGGAEPQSPQRMYLHPDSPATGAHWQAQPILFNKVKLTNNTLDNNGHIVLASMHKYQPRLHVIRTSDLTQIPWAPQQAFVFPETEFVAVTAYQNDRITKLKIDNNPFAKGFRETGQSRCKRKMSSSPLHEDQQQQHQQQHDQSDHLQFANNVSPAKSTATSATSICSPSDKQVHMLNDLNDGQRIKRMRSNGSACSIASFDDVIVVVGGDGEACSGNNSASSSGNSSPSLAAATITTTSRTTLTSPLPAPQPPSQQQHTNGAPTASSSAFMHHFQQNFQQNMQTLLRPSLVDLACSYFGRPQPLYPQHMGMYAGNAAFVLGSGAGAGEGHGISHGESISLQIPEQLPFSPIEEVPSLAFNVAKNTPSALNDLPMETMFDSQPTQLSPKEAPVITKSPAKKKGFSISAILEGSS